MCVLLIFSGSTAAASSGGSGLSMNERRLNLRGSVNISLKLGADIFHVFNGVLQVGWPSFHNLPLQKYTS